MSKIIRILGLDPSLANTGWAVADIDLQTLKIVQVVEMGTVVTQKSKNKRVRKSSDDLERARQSVGVIRALIDKHNVKIACSEVPSGAQSASASRAFGIVVGILASLTVPLVEVNPTEVKLAVAGNKIADKEDIVRWAVNLTKDHPVEWNTSKQPNDWEILVGERYITKTMEHQADAIAGIAAALATNEFRQIAAVLAQLI